MALTIRKLIHPIYRDLPPLQLSATSLDTSFPHLSQAERPCPQHTSGISALPDELILLILRNLGAEGTICTLECPRNAFNFAITNTRFLILFRTFLSRVFPNMENDQPKTLSKRHLLSVIRIAGPHLRELALPRSARQVLYHLPTHCPNLRKLSFVDHHNHDMLPVKKALMLPLTYLHIVDPSRSTIALITHPPEELYLTRCLPYLSKELGYLLATPPRKLYLEIRETDPALSHPFFQTHLSHIFDSIERAVHRIEDLTFLTYRTRFSIAERNNPILLTDAQYIVTDTIRSQTSSCRRVVLATEAMRLLRVARSDAEVVLQNQAQSFTCVNGTLYPVRLPLWDVFMTQDLSYVHTVLIGTSFNLRWRKLLANTKLRLAVVHDPCLAGQLQLSTTVLEVRTLTLRDVNWRKYKDVRELRLIGSLEFGSSYGLRQFFYQLKYLLEEFQGKVVWLSQISPIVVHSNYELTEQEAKDTLDAVDRFESSGGDAGTVRAFITQMRWRSRAFRRMAEVKRKISWALRSSLCLRLDT